MKTPDEIKKGLECCSGIDLCAKCPYKGECKWFRTPATDALALIQQLEKMLHESFERNTPFMEAAYGLSEKVWKLEAEVPKWTSVEERLPDWGEVLVCTIGNWVGVAWHHGSGRFETASRLRLTVDGVLRVSHWMPLPEPPVEV